MSSSQQRGDSKSQATKQPGNVPEQDNDVRKMYGASATELIKHISRDHGEIIPEYHYKLVDKIMKENDELFADNVKTSQTATQPQRPPDDTQAGHQTSSNGEQNDRPKSSEPIPGTSNKDRPLPVGQTSLDDCDGDTEADEAQDDIDLGEKELMMMQIRHTAKLWNKRCIIAYHYERLKILKKLRWEYGNNLPREIVKNLSPSELEWFTKYNDNLFSYMSALNEGKGLDLTLYITPPKKLYIQVKCIRDYGQFDLEDGQPVMLKKDSIHYLPLSQCEKLIHQGVLEQTSL